ncbi:(2Fe-2S) ferredoxin domain-containing protein [Cyanobium sp. Morenito 9A2]|nr:(2Fe-2S) ferredoxin domain-containing protein [Cyanobium sp. Morenito 9A2]
MGIQHHLLLCATPSRPVCCDPAVGAASWEKLKALVREHDLENPSRIGGIVLRTKVDCLRHCSGGPILLVWPEGIWYGEASAERLERIVREHLIGGQVIEDWVLRRTPFEPFSAAEAP